MAPTTRPRALSIILVYKMVAGTVEAVLGSVILVTSAFALDQRLAFIERLFADELQEDPQDRLVHGAVTAVTAIGMHASVTLGAFLVLLGVVKIAIAVGIWRRSHFARDATLVILGIAGALATVELLRHFSSWKLIALAADGVLLWYVWHIPHTAAASSSDSAST